MTTYTYHTHDGNGELVYREDAEGCVRMALETGLCVGDRIWTQQLDEVVVVEICEHLPYGGRVYRMRVVGRDDDDEGR